MKRITLIYIITFLLCTEFYGQSSPAYNIDRKRDYQWVLSNSDYGSLLDFHTLPLSQHGNGRDWWVIIFDYDGMGYSRLLLTPQGFESLLKGTAQQQVLHSTGQAVFSPDGTKYTALVIYKCHDYPVPVL